MSSNKATLALTALTLTLTALVSGCGSNQPANTTAGQSGQLDPAQAATRNACDAIRIRTRKKALREFGINQMVEKARIISRQIQAEDRENLRRLSSSSAWGVNPELYRESARMTQQIYEDAIDRAGIKRNVGENHPEIKRWINASPSGYSSGYDGFTIILASDGMGMPFQLGEVSTAYLMINTDQTQYRVLFNRTKTISKNTDGSAAYELESITMSQYVESTLPQYCAGSGSAIPADQLDLIPAGGA
jgi:hypothetical protein